MSRSALIATLLLVGMTLGATLRAQTSLDIRIPQVGDPGDTIEVFLDLTSTRDDIASVGARLTYDSGNVNFSTVDLGAGIPGSWSLIYQDTATAGQVDVVMTDQSISAAVIAGPVVALEALRLTFTRVGTNCNQSAYGFNAAAPAPGPPTAAFPQNHYVIYVDPGNQLQLEGAATTGASGPVTEDHRFIRGNVNNRAAGTLDLGDAVDLVNSLFGVFVFGFDCQGAVDVNNDGGQNILDVVALIQGTFGATGFVIPPPTGVPGLVDQEGGAIPSVLGCAEGEACL